MSGDRVQRSRGETLPYVGKIGVFGSIGSGKTKFIKLLTNLANKRILHNYDESEETYGTTKTHPYSVPLKNNRVLLIDNPGQNSLEYVRESVAKSGDLYSALILILDSTNVNFWETGLKQCIKIGTSIKNSSIPILIVISKYDLYTTLTGRKAFVDELSHRIEEIVSKIEPGKKLPYFDKKSNKVDYIIFESESNEVPFTQLEQIIVNGLDAHFNINPVQGLTQINIRLIVRSLLLGFCDLIRNYALIGEFTKSHPNVVIPLDIKKSLSNFRPTAFESKTTWSRISNNEHQKEPFLILDYFKFANIASILKKDVILSSLDQISDFIKENKSQANIKNYFVYNPNKRDSLETILEGINSLVESEDFITASRRNESFKPIPQEKDTITSKFQAIKPPPKPKRVEWNDK